MPFTVSVDTGGTFTDIVIAKDGEVILIEKALTTHDRIFEGMRAAMIVGAERMGLTLEQLLAQTELLIYGTTRAVNAVVEGKIAKTALILTEGFADILVYREGGKAKPHDSTKEYPAPYIPRRHTFQVRERIGSEGDILTALDVGKTRALLADIRERGFEAVAVCLLWSVVNRAHELAIGKLIEEELPGVPFTLSHQLIPIVREYRRASATSIDASLKPLMEAHLREMEADLRASGYMGDILVSTSVGGCMTVDELAARPIHLLKSGPAMAPVAGRHYARVERAGGDVIVCDTGGTTFDVGLIRDGELIYSRDTWLGPKWTGHIMSMSSVDIRSIGAGGGSIAYLDAGGLLRVGPRSAGSFPGPACYGRGGDDPTVTDAAVVLGYIDPDYFLGGRMMLDKQAAERVVGRLAGEIGLSSEDTAYSIMSIANEHMIKAIHEITVNEGINPRESILLAGGGAAGMNIGMIAHELGCSRVLVPATASALSASGMQFSDIVFEHSASGLIRTNDFDYAVANAALDKVRAELERFLHGLNDQASALARFEFFVEARYLFQIWELEVPLSKGELNDESDLAELVKGFHRVHERVFAVVDPDSPVECVSWKGRVVVSVGGSSAKADREDMAGSRFAKVHKKRKAYFGDGWVDAAIILGNEMNGGDVIDGPAIIEEPTTTIVVYPGMYGRRTAQGNYMLHFGQAQCSPPAAAEGRRDLIPSDEGASQ